MRRADGSLAAATLDQSRTAAISFSAQVRGPQFADETGPIPVSNAQTFTAGLSGSLAQVELLLSRALAGTRALVVEVRDTLRRAPGPTVLSSASAPPSGPWLQGQAGYDLAFRTYVDTTPIEYAFDGFFAPIDADAFNGLKAGRAVPARFSLGGDQGLGVLAAGSPTSRPVSCDASVPADPVEETAAAGASGLSYDAATGTYAYAWKTAKAGVSPAGQDAHSPLIW